MKTENLRKSLIKNVTIDKKNAIIIIILIDWFCFSSVMWNIILVFDNTKKYVHWVDQVKNIESNRHNKQYKSMKNDLT